MTVPQGKTVYPLSAAQKILLWAEALTLEPTMVKQNNIVGGYLRVAHDCDERALEEAYHALLRYNDALRLRLFWTVRGIRQYIQDDTCEPLARLSVDGEAAFDAYINKLSREKMTFFDESLTWARLVTLGPGDCALVLRIHHAAVDGYSVRLVFERLEQYYECCRQGRSPEPKEVFSTQKHFELEAGYASSERHKEDRKYWLHQYTHQRKFSFPAGYRSEFGACALECMTLRPQDYRRLQEMTRENHCTLQYLLMTLAAATTYAVTGKENFCICSPTHGRINRYLRNTVGCMMNLIPFFYDLSPETTLEELISKCFIPYMEAFSHGRLPMSEQIPMSYYEAIKHFFNFNPAWLLFSSMEYGGTIDSSAYRIGMIPQTNIAHQFYLSMLEVPNKRVDFELSYQVHKFKPATVQRLLRNYDYVIRRAVEDPKCTLMQLRHAYEKGEMDIGDPECDPQRHAEHPWAG